MKKKKFNKLFIGPIILAAICLIVVFVGVAISNDDCIVYGTIGIFIAILYFIYEILVIKSSKENKTNNSYRGALDNLRKQYKSLVIEEDVGLNEVKFVNKGLVFSAKGKFACKKDFNNIKGYHFAFIFEGKKLIKKPDNYRDVEDYQDLLFLIELGYFEKIPFSEPENEKGVLIKDSVDLLSEGKPYSFEIDSQSGYTAYCGTAECDDIDLGKIEIIEWNKQSKILKFKLLVEAGLNDIVIGKIKLDGNKQFDKIEEEQT